MILGCSFVRFQESVPLTLWALGDAEMSDPMEMTVWELRGLWVILRGGIG